jgi:hypothetical protein
LVSIREIEFPDENELRLSADPFRKCGHSHKKNDQPDYEGIGKALVKKPAHQHRQAGTQDNPYD